MVMRSSHAVPDQTGQSTPKPSPSAQGQAQSKSSKSHPQSASHAEFMHAPHLPPQYEVEHVRVEVYALTSTALKHK
ncbi:hypothetical protein M407DRAFT_28658 [Tulasnella calospora MUT 4182]|uniref:Uncharacterized protein n=1 Tax=Tulasnella calospora MUT 4182 TaxID=1051891 RepID=A0A0C3QAC8_9AGAM|nr:hypothetical protein M407DRAFT_28658 [Tulasnella calospora MUT 4182]